MKNTINVKLVSDVKNGRPWSALAIDAMFDGKPYVGLVFPPRTQSVSEDEAIVWDSVKTK